MERNVTTVLKVEFGILVEELRALREAPRKTYGGRLDTDHGDRQVKLMSREVKILEELQPLFDSAVEVLRLNKEQSRNRDWVSSLSPVH